MNILVIGYSTRYIVCAGKRAGYTVYSLDHFGDVDLLRCADKYDCFDEIADNDELLGILDRLNWDFDAIILGTGFEYADLEREGYR
ncbi:MAG TPA: ATP-dependent carboligase, partial [Methanosarcinales archaeon]|nr:ATP-dependent carboligase [Methanosarcinales archaeon]